MWDMVYQVSPPITINNQYSSKLTNYVAPERRYMIKISINTKVVTHIENSSENTQKIT